MKSKYGNRKTKVDGITFDSVKEANRWAELRLLERAGEIQELERQKKFILIPAQKDKNGKVIERECSYVADFVYFADDGTGWMDMVVEDAKGMRTDVYKIKRKLMLKEHGIRIKEV